jgi:hypothetical protein
MNYAQLVGRRNRILRDIEQAQRDEADASGHLRRLREEYDLIELQLAGRCIPRLTDVVAASAAEFLRS